MGEVKEMLNRIDQSSVQIEQKASAPVQVKTEVKKIEAQPEKRRDEKLSDNEAKAMTDSMNDFLVSADSQLRFVYHDGLSEYYVTIVDSVTDEVIREIPSKKLMDIHAAMKEFVGLLIDRKI